ncbi:uncharacterized protein LOC114279075 [Camellia sinensis]|uniref:uncharacterized protein LOC114279075 n=1 Tax=Camellia sinensis TaxID=4442 RepID=UPI0010358BA0|nr:uncharacterized protein LOC114279075 [Camellia sinensis]
MGFPEPSVPSVPPDDMRLADRLTLQGVIDARLGIDALLYLEDGEYATYHHTYLMPPLTGVRTPSRRSTGMPSSSRTRARDIPSAGRAGTSRGGVGLVPPIPPTYHDVGWPGIPTELTGWRYSASYPIPLEPPMPDHPYTRDPNSPPPTTEYAELLLGLVASLEGMVLRREAQLSIMGVSVLFSFLAFIIFLMTC